MRVRSMSGASTDKRALHGSEVSSGPGPAGKKDVRASRACGEWRGGKEAAVRRGGGGGDARCPQEGALEVHAPAQKEHMQGVRGGKYLSPPAQKEPMQGCGGSSLCPHQRLWKQCKECGGASICPHQCRRSKCKDCGVGSNLPVLVVDETEEDCGGAAKKQRRVKLQGTLPPHVSSHV